MSTQADVRAAWAANIWTAESIKEITPQIFDYDVLREFNTSMKELSSLYYNQEINFIVYIISRSQRLRMMGQIEQTFTAEIRVYRQANVSGSNFNDLLDAYEAIDSQVVSSLDSNWATTVDYYTPQPGPAVINKIEINNIACWSGTYLYTGVKNL